MLAQETDEVPLEDWQQEKVLIEEDVHAFIKNRKGREAWTLCFGEHERTAAFSPPLSSTFQGQRCIGLPRQARDKHERKNANKNCVFLKNRCRLRLCVPEDVGAADLPVAERKAWAGRGALHQVEGIG